MKEIAAKREMVRELAEKKKREKEEREAMILREPREIF